MRGSGAFFVFLGCVLSIQVYLAIKVVILHAESNKSNDNIFQEWLPVDTNTENDVQSPSSLVHQQHLRDVKVTKYSDGSKTNNPITNSSVLDYSTLSFVPECDITVKESISAIQRAKTDGCKEQLAKTACKIIADSLYPKRLPRYCLHKEVKYGKHLGCFQDEQKNRILPDAFTLMKENNSPINCIDLCLQSGFQFAGVQYSIECFCGNSRPSETFLLDSRKCNMKCPSLSVNQNHHFDNESSDWHVLHITQNPKILHDTNKRTCGGFFAMNVYETGVFHDSESNNHVKTLDEAIVAETAVKPVRVVFLLTLNGRSYRQVIRLIKSLFHERHFFYIHVDARQDYLYRELLMLARKLPNHFRFMTSRRATIWGGASLLDVLLTAMHDLVTRADEWNWQWDYVINLSESDFPLKTTKRLETFLSLNNGRNFVKSHGRDVRKFIQKQGLDKTFYECDYRMWRMGDRTLPKGIVMDGGSDWIALNRKFVEYVVKTDDDLVQGLKKVFSHTLLPAESFFHTVLRNSEFCETFVDNNLHVTNWKRKLGCKCQYRNVVDWCGCSPNDFRLTDWQRLQLTESRLLFFGRKFEPVVNQGIVNKLESWLYPGRFEAHCETANRYWQSIYHHYDLSPKPDDTVITLGHSLGRLAAKSFLTKYSRNISSLSSISRQYSNIDSTNNEEEADVSSEAAEFEYDGSSNLKIMEISIYSQDDRIQGILVKFHKGRERQHIALEAFFKFKFSTWSRNLNSKSLHRDKIQEIQVGVDYDQKEQIFRHFARSIGPMSEPTLAYNVVTDEAFNVTFVWLNSIQSIQAVVNVSIGEGSTANFVKPHLKTPLTPGNWTVQLLSAEDGDLLSQVQFLVMPLQFYGGLPISSTHSRIMHTAPPNDQHVGLAESEIKSSRELISWIDSLVAPYYEFQDLCLDTEMHLGDDDSKLQKLQGLSTCSQTNWSSLFPDFKSTIDGIDEHTGLLVP